MYTRGARTRGAWGLYSATLFSLAAKSWPPIEGGLLVRTELAKLRSLCGSRNGNLKSQDRIVETTSSTPKFKKMDLAKNKNKSPLSECCSECTKDIETFTLKISKSNDAAFTLQLQDMIRGIRETCGQNRCLVKNRREETDRIAIRQKKREKVINTPPLNKVQSLGGDVTVCKVLGVSEELSTGFENWVTKQKISNAAFVVTFMAGARCNNLGSISKAINYVNDSVTVPHARVVVVILKYTDKELRAEDWDPRDPSLPWDNPTMGLTIFKGKIPDNAFNKSQSKIFYDFLLSFLVALS